jgi:hypothetical protein
MRYVGVLACCVCSILTKVPVLATGSHSSRGHSAEGASQNVPRMDHEAHIGWA